MVGPMPMPEQIVWKLWRAKHHYDELVTELRAYFASNPGDMVTAPNSTPENVIYVFRTKTRVPARFGLIAGDYIHNVRSTLDYLIWQLVIANGETPDRSNQFPICTGAPKTMTWDESLKRGRLRGIDSSAIEIVRSVQPCFDTESGPAPHPLAVLEEINNENKHRRVLLTGLATVMTPVVKPPIGHAEFQVSSMKDGETVDGERFMAFLAFRGGIVEEFEILSTLEVINNFIDTDVLSKFEQFF
jgi:hypothetical protein